MDKVQLLSKDAAVKMTVKDLVWYTNYNRSEWDTREDVPLSWWINGFGKTKNHISFVRGSRGVDLTGYERGSDNKCYCRPIIFFPYYEQFLLHEGGRELVWFGRYGHVQHLGWKVIDPMNGILLLETPVPFLNCTSTEVTITLQKFEERAFTLEENACLVNWREYKNSDSKGDLMRKAFEEAERLLEQRVENVERSNAFVEGRIELDKVVSNLKSVINQHSRNERESIFAQTIFWQIDIELDNIENFEGSYKDKGKEFFKRVVNFVECTLYKLKQAEEVTDEEKFEIYWYTTLVGNLEFLRVKLWGDA